MKAGHLIAIPEREPLGRRLFALARQQPHRDPLAIVFVAQGHAVPIGHREHSVFYEIEPIFALAMVILAYWIAGDDDYRFDLRQSAPRLDIQFCD
jgi:hypothetical protein